MSEGKAWRGTRGTAGIRGFGEFLLLGDGPGVLLDTGARVEALSRQTRRADAKLLAAAWNACQAIAGPDGNPLKVAGAVEEIVRAARMLHTAGDHEMGGANSANARSLATVALRKAGLL